MHYHAKLRSIRLVSIITEEKDVNLLINSMSSIIPSSAEIDWQVYCPVILREYVSLKISGMSKAAQCTSGTIEVNSPNVVPRYGLYFSHALSRIKGDKIPFLINVPPGTLFSYALLKELETVVNSSYGNPVGFTSANLSKPLKDMYRSIRNLVATVIKRGANDIGYYYWSMGNGYPISMSLDAIPRVFLLPFQAIDRLLEKEALYSVAASEDLATLQMLLLDMFKSCDYILGVNAYRAD